jgi:hypothetical protein
MCQRLLRVDCVTALAAQCASAWRTLTGGDGDARGSVSEGEKVLSVAHTQALLSCLLGLCVQSETTVERITHNDTLLSLLFGLSTGVGDYPRVGLAALRLLAVVSERNSVLGGKVRAYGDAVQQLLALCAWDTEAEGRARASLAEADAAAQRKGKRPQKKQKNSGASTAAAEAAAEAAEAEAEAESVEAEVAWSVAAALHIAVHAGVVLLNTHALAPTDDDGPLAVVLPVLRRALSWRLHGSDTVLDGDTVATLVLGSETSESIELARDAWLLASEAQRVALETLSNVCTSDTNTDDTPTTATTTTTAAAAEGVHLFGVPVDVVRLVDPAHLVGLVAPLCEHPPVNLRQLARDEPAQAHALFQSYLARQHRAASLLGNLLLCSPLSPAEGEALGGFWPMLYRLASDEQASQQVTLVGAAQEGATEDVLAAVTGMCCLLLLFVVIVVLLFVVVVCRCCCC